MRSPQCVFSLCGSVQRGSELSRDVVTRVNAGRLRAARTDGRAGGRTDGRGRSGEAKRDVRGIRAPSTLRPVSVKNCKLERSLHPMAYFRGLDVSGRRLGLWVVVVFFRRRSHGMRRLWHVPLRPRDLG